VTARREGLTKQRFVDFLPGVAPRFSLQFNLRTALPARPGGVSLTPHIAAFPQIKPLQSSRPLLYPGVLLE
jgi:hypothetical protein